VLHVLAAEVGAWTRREQVRVFGPAEVAQELPDDAETILDYDLELGACASYTAPDAKAGVHAMLLTFRTPLDALGVFARHTGGMTQRLSTTAAGYLEGPILHLYAGCFYLRIVPEQAAEAGAEQAQDLAAELGPRLPPLTERPRLTRVLPRGWRNPLRLDYKEVELFGEGEPAKALIADGELGEKTVQLVVMRAAADAQEARKYYEQMVTHFAEVSEVSRLPQLGEDAFVASHPSWGMCAGMLQDEFVAAALGAPTARDAQVLLRLLGIRIRTTRPLPTLANPGS